MSDLLEGDWRSIGELATLRGVSAQAISKRVARLTGLGVLHPRKGPAGTKLVLLAEFERAIALSGDAVRAQNGGGQPVAAYPVDDAPAAGNPVLAREQARRTAYQADLAGLDLDERLGKLVRTDDVRQGALVAAEAMTRAFDGIAGHLDDILTVAARDGKTAARALIKDLSRAALTALSDILGRQAAERAEAPT